MPSAVSDLPDHLGYWLRLVSNHVSYAFARRLAARDVTVAEWAMMRALYGRKPMAPSRLAETMGMTRGAITKLADRLVVKGLVTRETGEEDRRTQTLRLTRKADTLVPELAAAADENDKEWFGRLRADERRDLERILKAMAARLKLTAVPVD